MLSLTYTPNATGPAGTDSSGAGADGGTGRDGAVLAGDDDGRTAGTVTATAGLAFAASGLGLADGDGDVIGVARHTLAAGAGTTARRP